MKQSALGEEMEKKFQKKFILNSHACIKYGYKTEKKPN